MIPKATGFRERCCFRAPAKASRVRGAGARKSDCAGYGGGLLPCRAFRVLPRYTRPPRKQSSNLKVLPFGSPRRRGIPRLQSLLGCLSSDGDAARDLEHEGAEKTSGFRW